MTGKKFLSSQYLLSVLQGNIGNFAKLRMTELKYLGAVDLTQYFVKSYNFSDEDRYLNISTYGNKGVKVDFIFSRRLLNQVLTVFLPTVILHFFVQAGQICEHLCSFQIAIVVVSFCTSFFKV